MDSWNHCLLNYRFCLLCEVEFTTSFGHCSAQHMSSPLLILPHSPAMWAGFRGPCKYLTQPASFITICSLQLCSFSWLNWPTSSNFIGFNFWSLNHASASSSTFSKFFYHLVSSTKCHFKRLHTGWRATESLSWGFYLLRLILPSGTCEHDEPQNAAAYVFSLITKNFLCFVSLFYKNK